jgi:uncharacterized DUF497 family protein
MKFEWDAEKAAANLANHNVTFEEAETVFEDPLYIEVYRELTRTERESYEEGQSKERRRS